MIGKGSSTLQVLGCDEDSIEHVLHCCLWSKDSLIQHFVDDPDALRREAGLTGNPAIPPPSEGAELTCPVCLLTVPTSEMLWLWCNHVCCKVGTHGNSCDQLVMLLVVCLCTLVYYEN